jgi:Fur family ferric uptake transcriptional regulator
MSALSCGSDMPPQSVERWAALLTRDGSRMTAPRMAILEAIAARQEPFTAEELVEQLRGSGVGRATVFRTIDLLAGTEILHRIHGGSCHTYTACPPGHHHHLICRACGHSVNVDLCGLDEKIRALAEETDFAIEAHYLEFLGLCAACRDQ